MEQRRLRLGDVLDDYCPHERRLSNHVIVAMVGDEVIKTRCTTCDAEHPYKHGRVPARRRKKEMPSALFKDVLEGLTEERPAVAGRSGTAEPVTAPTSGSGTAAEPAETAADGEPPADSPAPQDVTRPDQSVAPEGTEETADEGPHHRVTLIRATLPRPEGQAASRQPPEFTMHRLRGGPSNRGRPRIRGGNASGWSGDAKPGGKGGVGARSSRSHSPGRPGRERRRSHGPRRSR